MLSARDAPQLHRTGPKVVFQMMLATSLWESPLQSIQQAKLCPDWINESRLEPNTSLDKSSIIQVVGCHRRRCCQASVISQSSPDAAQSAGAAYQVLISLYHLFGSVCFGPSSTRTQRRVIPLNWVSS